MRRSLLDQATLDWAWLSHVRPLRSPWIRSGGQKFGQRVSARHRPRRGQLSGGWRGEDAACVAPDSQPVRLRSDEQWNPAGRFVEPAGGGAGSKAVLADVLVDHPTA